MQGEGVEKEELEEGVDGGEDTRTWFLPDSKRQGSCNSFAFIHRLIRLLKKQQMITRLSGITAINKLQQLLDFTESPNIHPCSV